MDPDTVTPDPPPAAEPRRIPFLAISIALVAVMAGSALFLSGYSLGRQAATEPGTPPSQSEAFQPFWDTYHAISDRYAGGEVDRTKVVQGAIRGMIQALGDPYSAYLTSDEYRDSLLGISGQFEGIGAEIATAGVGRHGGLLAARKHVPPGRHQADRGLAGREGGRQGRRRRGLGRRCGARRADGRCGAGPDPRPEGLGRRHSPCARGGAPIQLTITRDVVQTTEVESKVLADGTVGYIGLAGFSDAAADDVVAALKAHLAAGRTKLILDVRGNPGGYVTAARKIASQFIASGPVFWEQDAQGNQVATEALGDGVATAADVDVVVLIDGGSASASEIVAGALQDTGRARLVGQQSFGKGTVQQWQELSGEGGAFKLTIARWLTPNKRWIHGTGLTPDVVVTLPTPLPAGSDPTLDKALQLLAGPTAHAGERVAA